MFDFDMPTQCANHCWYSYISVWFNTLCFLLLSPAPCPLSENSLTGSILFHLTLNSQRKYRQIVDYIFPFLSLTLKAVEGNDCVFPKFLKVSTVSEHMMAGVAYTANEVKAACR